MIQFLSADFDMHGSEQYLFYKLISPRIKYLHFQPQNCSFAITTFNEEKVKDFL